MSVGLALPDMGGLFKRRRIFDGLMPGRHARPTACIFAKCSRAFLIYISILERLSSRPQKNREAGETISAPLPSEVLFASP
jgi:hypothetical protein